MISPPPLNVYRIFLSSTDDPIVRKYRSAAKAIIRDEFSLKWLPVDMLDINPSDNQPIEVCREIILSCHIYIGILGAFYGSVNEQENLSYTEYEFKVAKESKRRMAVFLLPSEFTGVSYDYVVQQGPMMQRQQAFRTFVKSEESGLTIREVSDLEDFQKKLRSYLSALELEPAASSLLGASLKADFLSADAHLNYDRRLVQQYKVNHLDSALINKFLEQPQAKSALARARLLQPTVEEHLELLGISQGDRPTLGAFLCFAPKHLLVDKFASCSLHTVVYSETRRATSLLLNNEIIGGNLLNLFLMGMQFLSVGAGLQRIGRIGTGGRDELEIPQVALREALANALIHRDYEDDYCKDQSTRIEVYPDRLEITSYGRVPEGISVDKLNQNPEGVSPIRRNYIISEIFRIMQYGEMLASGIGRIHEVVQRASLRLPEIIQETGQSTVKVVFYRRQVRTLSETKVSLSRGGPNIFVSSTVRDLPSHRKEVIEACLRQNTVPRVVEQLTVSDIDAIKTSLELMDGADIYIGIFAQRYGYMPEGYDISITEMEYNRAVERGVVRLIFLMHDDHPIKASDVETGEGADKLRKLKKRLKAENVVNFFKSPEELRAHVINSLSQLRKPDLTKFHYVSDISAPPEPFIAHPYTLLQTHRLVGRQPELNLLTDWVTKPDSEVYRARILNIVAVGGMGKSALTWKWFNDIAPQEMTPLAGRMWWSFYESDATFENFVTRALAYVTRRPLEEVQQIPAPDRESQLLAALDREPFLLVLDGLERILIAYARMDAAQLSDDDYDKQTANFVANTYGLPASAAQSFTGEHRLRKTADPRAGSFLRKLSNVRASRILVSTRLYPADLQTVTGEPLGSCAATFLPGLADDDALDLWRAFGAIGARDSLLPLFQRADNHPLLIQALASEVARYRLAPGDFDAWRRAHPDFDPFSLPLVQGKSHVLAFALRGLDDKAQQVLRTIAAFRMPASYDTLATLLIGEGKPCADERELDKVLAELEDRGLVGWDKRANRYDLHPLVRGVVWSGLSDDARRGVYTSLHAHFEAVPMIDEPLTVNSLEDLTPAIELYNTLIGLGRYDDAFNLFVERLNKATLYRLSASRQRVELLELLFPAGLEQLPRLNSQADQSFTLDALAQGYHFSGQPGRAAALFRRANTIVSEMKDDGYLGVGLYNLSYTLLLSGALVKSEAAARRALVILREQSNRFKEAVSLQFLGSTLATRGLANESGAALRRALRLFTAQSQSQSEGVVNSYLAQRELWLGEFSGALSFANRAWELAHVRSFERDFIRAARVQGAAALGLNDIATADERLHHALTRARKVNHAEEELPALVALGESRRRQGEWGAARELLEDVWEAAERGPYPLFHADACSVLAEVERDEGKRERAVEAAMKAYRLAWCDGPPFAYHWGLEKARGLLRELGAGEPEMPAFDESKFEAMPEVEIDPADEFGAGSVGEGEG